jgi:Holliday junction resolvase RusA-like endonuclease
MLPPLDREALIEQIINRTDDEPDHTFFIDGYCQAKGVNHLKELHIDSLNELLDTLGGREDREPMAPIVLTGPPFFVCELPLTPHSVNESLRPIKMMAQSGRGFARLSMTPKARATAEEMTLKFKCARLLQDFKLTKFPVVNKVLLKIEFVFPDYIVRDISNRIKSLEDALVKADVIQDDNLVYSLIVSKVIEKGVRKTRVSLWVL